MQFKKIDVLESKQQTQKVLILKKVKKKTIL